jgi:hypothetical protein
MEKRVEKGNFHDLGDTKWIVVRGQLRGHNNTPFRQPTPGHSIGRPGVGCPQGICGGFSYYQVVMILINIVPLIIEFTNKHFEINSSVRYVQPKLQSAVLERLVALLGLAGPSCPVLPRGEHPDFADIFVLLTMVVCCQ